MIKNAGKDGVPKHTNIELLYMYCNLSAHIVKQLYILAHIVTLYNYLLIKIGDPNSPSRRYKMAAKYKMVDLCKGECNIIDIILHLIGW